MPVHYDIVYNTSNFYPLFASAWDRTTILGLQDPRCTIQLQRLVVISKAPFL